MCKSTTFLNLVSLFCFQTFLNDSPVSIIRYEILLYFTFDHFKGVFLYCSHCLGPFMSFILFLLSFFRFDLYYITVVRFLSHAV